MASTPTLALESAGKTNEQVSPELDKARFSSFHARSNSPPSGSRQDSPNHSPRFSPSRLSNSDRSQESSLSDLKLLGFLWDQKQQLKTQRKGKRKAAKSWYSRKRVKGLVALIGLVGLFFLVNWIMLLRLQDQAVNSKAANSSSVSVPLRKEVC